MPVVINDLEIVTVDGEAPTVGAESNAVTPGPVEFAAIVERVRLAERFRAARLKAW
jgi:hypothetical protein